MKKLITLLMLLPWLATAQTLRPNYLTTNPVAVIGGTVGAAYTGLSTNSGSTAFAISATSDLAGWRGVMRLVAPQSNNELDYIPGLIKKNGMMYLYFSKWPLGFGNTTTNGANRAQIYYKAGHTYDEIFAATPTLAIASNAAGGASIVGRPEYEEGGTNYLMAFNMKYAGFETANNMTAVLFYSTDGTTWTASPGNPVFTQGTSATNWSFNGLFEGPLIKNDSGTYDYYPAGIGPNGENTAHLTTANLLAGSWTDRTGVSILTPTSTVNDLITIVRRRNGSYAGWGRQVGIGPVVAGLSYTTSLTSVDRTNWTYLGTNAMIPDITIPAGALAGHYGQYVFDNGGSPAMLTDENTGGGIVLWLADSESKTMLLEGVSAAVSTVTPTYVETLMQQALQVTNIISTNLVPTSLNYTNYVAQGIGQATLAVTPGSWYMYFATAVANTADGTYFLQIVGTNTADGFAGDLYVDVTGGVGGLIDVSTAQTNIIFKASQSQVTFANENATSGPVTDHLYLIKPPAASYGGYFQGIFNGNIFVPVTNTSPANILTPSRYMSITVGATNYRVPLYQ